MGAILLRMTIENGAAERPQSADIPPNIRRSSFGTLRLDRPTETVTLKGPQGRYATVRVADPANLPNLRIGQSVVVTYTEAMAVSLEKVDAR